MGGTAAGVAFFWKRGGRGAVGGALPPHLAALGPDVLVVYPLHRSVAAFDLERLPLRLKVPMGKTVTEARVARANLPGTPVPAYFIDHPEYFDREYLYGEPEGDYLDNAARFGFFARAALELFKALGEIPDIVHVHDWQGALAPVYLKTSASLAFPKSKSVLTIHNLSYQGLFTAEALEEAGLDHALFNWKQLEYYGKVSFLKGGIVFADALTTVSPTYAKEIQTPELGCGFDGLLRDREDRLTGILNGVDYREWSPEKDRHLPATYSGADLKGKEVCKQVLQRKFGLPERREALLIGFIGRLVEQKGIDLLCAAAERLVGLDLQIAILGTGDPRYEDMLTRLAAAPPTKGALKPGFNESRAPPIHGGADALLIPPKFH